MRAREITSESSSEQTKELDIFGTPCALFRPQELLETSDSYRNASNREGDGVGRQLVVAQACDRKHEIELRAARMPRRQARAATHDVVQHHVIFEIDEGLTTRFESEADLLKRGERSAERGDIRTQQDIDIEGRDRARLVGCVKVDAADADDDEVDATTCKRP